MRAEFAGRTAHPSWRARVQFADWDRPAVNGNSFGLFVCVHADDARPDVRGIDLLDGGYPVGRLARLHESREVLASLCPGDEDRAVFGHLCIDRLVLRDAGEIAVVATDAHGRRHHLGDIGFSGNRAADCVEPQDLGLAPILVTSMGRSGSTVLANALGLHPAVMSVGGYPFEYRFFSWCLHAAHVASAPANHGTSMGGDAFETRHDFELGFNPFNHRDYDRLAGHDRLREFYEGAFAGDAVRFFLLQARTALAIHAREKPAARAFVEKMGGTPLANLAANTCSNLQEIVLLREFRDMVGSMIAFDAKRGTTGFYSPRGRKEADAWLVELAFRQAHLAHRARLRGKLLVAYEDLVRDPRACMARIAPALGLGGDVAAIESMLGAFGENAYTGQHSTMAQRKGLDLEAIFSAGAIAAAEAMIEAAEPPAVPAWP